MASALSHIVGVEAVPAARAGRQSNTAMQRTRTAASRYFFLLGRLREGENNCRGIWIFSFKMEPPCIKSGGKEYPQKTRHLQRCGCLVDGSTKKAAFSSGGLFCVFVFGYTLKHVQYSMVLYTGQAQNRIDSGFFRANFMPGCACLSVCLRLSRQTILANTCWRENLKSLD